jgi:hypothetical protein
MLFPLQNHFCQFYREGKVPEWRWAGWPNLIDVDNPLRAPSLDSQWLACRGPRVESSSSRRATMAPLSGSHWQRQQLGRCCAEWSSCCSRRGAGASAASGTPRCCGRFNSRLGLCLAGFCVFHSHHRLFSINFQWEKQTNIKMLKLQTAWSHVLPLHPCNIRVGRTRFSCYMLKKKKLQVPKLFRGWMHCCKTDVECRTPHKICLLI